MKGTRNRLHGILALLAFGAVIAITMPAAASVTRAFKDTRHTKAFWHQATAKPAALGHGVRPVLKLRSQHVRSFALNRVSLHRVLAAAPRERTRAARLHPLVVSLPAPNGNFQRFCAPAVGRSWPPGLAATHPEIKTYSGRGIDDPTATIHADLSPLGFHASVRSPNGAWYIDPYYHLDQSVYASYYGRDVPAERDGHAASSSATPTRAELSVDKGYYHAADTSPCTAAASPANAAVTITISDPEEQLRVAHAERAVRRLGAFDASFVADPDGNLETHIVEARPTATTRRRRATRSSATDDPTVDPPTGDVLRTYRLALITDPGYADVLRRPGQRHGGEGRADQPRRPGLRGRPLDPAAADREQRPAEPRHVGAGDRAERAVRRGRVLHAVAGHGLLVDDARALRDRPDHRRVELRHRPPRARPAGRRRREPRRRRPLEQGRRLHRHPDADGDFYAIDYVAHEMGHQFSGNHPFNGNQLNCSGGNRNAATSVEPGSGSSIMAYAGICLTDDLQPHSDPYFSQRSLQEISTYTSSNQAAINEVQTASLRHFGGGNEVQVVTFGPGYAAGGHDPAAQPSRSAPRRARRSCGGAAGERQHGHDLDRRRGRAHAAGRRLGHDRGRRRSPATTARSRSLPCRASRSFTYTNPIAGLARSGGGTVTLAAPGATESGNTVTIRTAAAHGRSVGDIVADRRRRRRRLQRHLHDHRRADAAHLQVHDPDRRPRQLGRRHGDVLLAVPGPDRRQRLGRDRRQRRCLHATRTSRPRSTRSPGFAGTATVTRRGLDRLHGHLRRRLGRASTCRASQLVNLSCGGCFASVEETNHGGANDSFTLNYNGNVSAPIMNGVELHAPPGSWRR